MRPFAIKPAQMRRKNFQSQCFMVHPRCKRRPLGPLADGFKLPDVMQQSSRNHQILERFPQPRTGRQAALRNANAVHQQPTSFMMMVVGARSTAHKPAGDVLVGQNATDELADGRGLEVIEDGNKLLQGRISAFGHMRARQKQSVTSP